LKQNIILLWQIFRHNSTFTAA